MCLVQSGLVRGTFADHGLAANQCRFVGFLCSNDRCVNGIHVMTVHIADNVPAISFETFRRIVGKPAFDIAIDGNAVVVVKGNQFVQLPRTGQRTGFMGNAFHQATVAEENVGVVIDDIETGLVEFFSQQLFSQCHADTVRNTLSKRTGCGIDTRGQVDFRMSRCF